MLMARLTALCDYRVDNFIDAVFVLHPRVHAFQRNRSTQMVQYVTLHLLKELYASF
jgi:hypothetical protein